MASASRLRERGAGINPPRIARIRVLPMAHRRARAGAASGRREGRPGEGPRAPRETPSALHTSTRRVRAGHRRMCPTVTAFGTQLSPPIPRRPGPVQRFRSSQTCRQATQIFRRKMPQAGTGRGRPTRVSAVRRPREQWVAGEGFEPSKCSQWMPATPTAHPSRTLFPAAPNLCAASRSSRRVSSRPATSRLHIWLQLRHPRTSRDAAHKPPRQGRQLSRVRPDRR